VAFRLADETSNPPPPPSTSDNDNEPSIAQIPQSSSKRRRYSNSSTNSYGGPQTQTTHGRPSKKRRGTEVDDNMRFEGQSSNAEDTTTSSNGNVPNGSSGKSNSNGAHDMTTRPSGPFFGHDREEVTRILIQSLTDLGYHGAATSLSRESGYELENPSVAAFRDAILSGEWTEAEALLFGSSQEDGEGGVTLKDDGHKQNRWSGGSASRGSQQGLPLSESANKKEMLFEIRQQKYLEFLEQRDIGSALTVLRTELTPNHTDTQHLHEITG